MCFSYFCSRLPCTQSFLEKSGGFYGGRSRTPHLTLTKNLEIRGLIFSFALPVVSRHQRLLRLRLDPVKKRAIGFSFQLAINRHQLDTSRARLLPPGQGQRPSGRCADLNHARRAQFLRHPCACPRFYVFGSTKNSLFIFFLSTRRLVVGR